jgi:arabinan endo-1,5-alpha-L-arabinosidase
MSQSSCTGSETHLHLVSRRTLFGSVSTSAIVTLALTLSGIAVAQDGDVVGVHDPAIIKQGRWYYIFSTSLPNEFGIPVRRSADLFTWRLIDEVFETFPKWVAERNPPHRNLWAPHVVELDGIFNLYYSVADIETNRAALALATNTTLDVEDARYQCKDMGPVIVTEPVRDDWRAIDPCVLQDAEGDPWLILGSYWQGIKGMKLDRRTGKLAAERRIHSLASRNGGPIEAPYVVAKDGMYYLFVSFDFCCRGLKSNYKTMVGRSKNIMGPYAAYDGGDMRKGAATLVLQSHGEIVGPGHNSVYEENGEWFFVHHFYDRRANGMPKLQIRPLYWLPDGWPVVGEPLVGAPGRQEDQQVDMAGVWVHRVNYEGNGHQIRFEADNTMANGIATWKLEKRSLTMHWRKPDGHWIDTCVVAPDGLSYVGRNQAGAVISGLKVTQGRVAGGSVE